MSAEEILGSFYKQIPLSFDGKLWVGDVASFEGLEKYRLNYDLINPKDKKVLLTKVTATLKEEGDLLDEPNSETWKTRKVPSTKGKALGIYMVESV